VQVAVSQSAAAALGLAPGDRVRAEDDQHRRFSIVVSGVYRAADGDADAWQVSPQLLQPEVGVSDGAPSASAAALVSVASLPDLRVGVPADDLTYRVVFHAEPTRLRWRDAAVVQRAIGSLQSSGGASREAVSWDSLLVRVLDDGRAQVAAAQGQAQVLLVGLLASALLVLVLAAQLLVGRRRASVVQARERGASLLGIGLELFVETLLVALAGAAVGLLTTWLLVGEASWVWSVPVVVVAATAAPVLGAIAAARATSSRRAPANRSARRIAARARRLQRLGVEVAVLVAAVLSFVALRQRGVGDLTVASAAVWWAVAGTVVVIRLLPPAVGLALRAARHSTGDVRFLVAARLAEAGTRALPLLVVAVAVAQLTFGLVLAASEREGQAAAAMLSVGGDARLTAPPDPSLADAADSIAQAPSVRAAVAARVDDDVRASSRRSAQTVRLVVVESSAFEHLLGAFARPDHAGLARLRQVSRDDGRVPALLLGGDADLRHGLAVQWEKAQVPLAVVGEAPRVEASVEPVVVVDAKAFAATGAVAQPNTVWAVGPGAAAAAKANAGPSGTVVTYADALDERRRAPLPSALIRLALASAALLMVFALLGPALAAAVEAPDRGASLGRLRSLGLADSDLRKVLVGELLIPPALAVLAGLGLGIGAASAMLGSLPLGSVTGGSGAPAVVVPWPLPLILATVLVGVLLLGLTEWRQLRRRPLAQLLRS